MNILQRVGDTRAAIDKQAMIAMSPSAMIDKLKAIPILHLHGGRDDITAKEDSQQFVDDMLAVNPRYTFVGMPQAGHGLYPHRSQYYALAENFLGKCLDVPMQEITKAEATSMVDFEFKGGVVDHGAAPKAP